METSISLGYSSAIPPDQFPSLSRHPSDNYRFFLLARQIRRVGDRNRKLNKSRGRERDRIGERERERERERQHSVRWGSTLAKLQAALQMHVQPLYGFSISFTLCFRRDSAVPGHRRKVSLVNRAKIQRAPIYSSGK